MGYIREVALDATLGASATATRRTSRITSAPNFVHILNYLAVSSR